MKNNRCIALTLAVESIPSTGWHTSEILGRAEEFLKFLTVDQAPSLTDGQPAPGGPKGKKRTTPSETGEAGPSNGQPLPSNTSTNNTL